MNDIRNSPQPSLLARILKTLAQVEPQEVNAVMLSMLSFFFLFGSYSVIKPVRDAMGTVYGVKNLDHLFTITFFTTLVVAPIYASLASRIRLSTFLPWVYGVIAVSMLLFFGLFVSGQYGDKSVAAAFYVWVSVFNMLIISVFWTFMSDIFSRTQAKRLYGFIAVGATVGGIVGPLIGASLAKIIGNNNLMLISAGGFVVTAVLIRMLAHEKQRLLAAGGDVQHTSLDQRLKGNNPFDGFVLLFRSPYLLLLALFLLLMTWISTIVYIQLGDLISKTFPDRNARTSAYAMIDLMVNSGTVLIQLLGTGRIIERFGVKAGLLVNPVLMVIAFLGIAFSPVLMVLGGIQVIRRIAEYAVAKPTREMLFTVVDQQSKYKAKNVIDTVVYRGGDVTAAWIADGLLGYGVGGLAIFGAIICVLWFPIAYVLGKRYENARSGLVDAPEPARH